MRQRAAALVIALLAITTTALAGSNIFLASDDFETMLWDEHWGNHPELREWYGLGTLNPAYVDVTQSSQYAHSGTYSARIWNAGPDQYGWFPGTLALADYSNPDDCPPASGDDPLKTYKKRFVDVSVYIWDDYDPAGDPNDYDEGFAVSPWTSGYSAPTATIGVFPAISLTHYSAGYGVTGYESIERRQGWTQFRLLMAGDQLRYYIDGQLFYSHYYLDPDNAANGFGQVAFFPVTTGGPSERGLYIDDWSSVTLIPEPATLMLLGLGGATLLRRRRR